MGRERHERLGEPLEGEAPFKPFPAEGEVKASSWLGPAGKPPRPHAFYLVVASVQTIVLVSIAVALWVR